MFSKEIDTRAAAGSLISCEPDVRQFAFPTPAQSASYQIPFGRASISRVVSDTRAKRELPDPVQIRPRAWEVSDTRAMRELRALERSAALDCLVPTPAQSAGYQIAKHRMEFNSAVQTPAQDAGY